MQTPDTELLRRWMDHQATAEEAAYVERWLQRAGAGPLFRQMDDAWEAGTESMGEIETAQLLQSVNSRLPVRSATVKRLWLRYLTAAAAVIIVVTTAAVWKHVSHPGVDQAVAWHVISNARSHKVYCTLPDSSEVWLSPQTVLHYRESALREVVLEGEAFFAVHRDPSRPFRVEAGGVQTLVLGTRFNVEAWPGEPTTYIALTEGSIRSRFLNRSGMADSLLITPGTALLYNRRSYAGIEKPVTTGSEADWTHNRIVLHDLSPEIALERIAAFYGKKLLFNVQMQNDQLFDAVLPGNDLDAALQNMAFVYRLSYRVAGDTIYINSH